MTKARLVALLLVPAWALALLLPAAAPAAQSLFLEIPGIPGESRDDRHRDAIDVLAFSWGVTAGGDRGRATFKDLTVTKHVDQASPQLFLRAARGQVIPAATLSVRGAGERPDDFLTYCLTEVRVTGVSTAGSAAGDRPTEEVSLAYGTFFETYRKQNPDGSLGAVFTAGWNVVDNALLGAPPAPC
jgi:type VI secretion system secreted protein Hcp